MAAPERLRRALSDKYRLKRELGAGATAVVYLADDLKHHRAVAIKVLKPELAASIGAERFLHEIEVAAQFTHPHILPLHDSGEADGFLYYVTPYIEGDSLRRRLDRQQQLPIDEAVLMTQQLAAALDYAHRHGVVHRDIKPENILIQDGQALVADFGIARALSAAGAAGLTQTGAVVGTPAYMSPEQVAGRPDLDARTDIYALGCVFYEMLAGETPFAAPTLEATLSRRLTNRAPRVSSIRETVPPAVDDVLVKALARTPADRFATAARFAEALEVAWGAGSVSMTQREAYGWRAWHRWTVTAAVLLLAITAAYLTIRTYSRGSPAPGLPRLVVLPFENLGSPDVEYFADGMADEITARLVGLSGLVVIARQSARLYKNSGKTPQQIGEELDADYLLEATVSWERARADRSRIRIRPQLVRTGDASHVWAEVYDEDATEVFAVQSRIAERVVEGLGVALLDRERRSLTVAPTVNTEAHDYYLRGLQYFNQSDRLFEERSTRSAIQLLEKAVALDPNFAHAHAALSRAYWDLYWYAVDRSDERLEMMKGAVERALELEPELPEARMAQALYFYARFEYGDALRVLRRLRTQQPHRAEVVFYIGTVLRREGKLKDAAAAIEEAARLSPRSPQFANNLGETYFYLRDYAAAERELHRAISLSPDAPQAHTFRAHNFVALTGATRDAWAVLGNADQVGLATDPLIAHHRIWLHVLDRQFEKAAEASRNPILPEAFDWQWWFVPRAQWLGEIYRLQNESDMARAQFDAARQVLAHRIERFPADPRYHSSLGVVYAGLGRRDEAIRSARQAVDLLPMTKEAIRGAYSVEALARVYTMIGDRDAAVGHLSELLSRPNHMSMSRLRLDPRWDPLRGHPAFEQLLQGGR